MTSIGYLSDIHAEFGLRPIKCPKIDILVIAGDLHTRPKGAKEILQKFRDITEVPIIYTLGNHEYYGHDINLAKDQYRKQSIKVKDVYLLDNEEIQLKGIKFIGSTFWSDLSHPLDALHAREMLNDFHVIKDKDNRLSTEKYTKLWQRSAEFVEGRLRHHSIQKDSQPVVVITHHSPTPLTCAPEFKRSSLRNCFHSNCTYLLEEYDPDIWIYGHDHRSNELNVFNTKLVSNQIGYFHEGQRELKVKVIKV